MKEKQITTKSRTARQNRTFRLSDYESRKLSEGAKAARMNESKVCARAYHSWRCGCNARRGQKEPYQAG